MADNQIAGVDMPDIRSCLYVVRGRQVMLDSDLATLYHVETRALNQAVKRNIKRFPEKYCFQLTKEEVLDLTSQIVMSSSEDGKNGYGGRRTLPYAFTEQGIAMLSAVLRSEVAIQTSIRIMDTYDVKDLKQLKVSQIIAETIGADVEKNVDLLASFRALRTKMYCH